MRPRPDNLFILYNRVDPVIFIFRTIRVQRGGAIKEMILMEFQYRKCQSNSWVVNIHSTYMLFASETKVHLVPFGSRTVNVEMDAVHLEKHNSAEL